MTDSASSSNLATTLHKIPGYRPVRSAIWYLTQYLRNYAAWPPLYLLWVLPRTLYRLLRDVVFVKDDPADPIMAYAYNTASNLTWYARLAADIRYFGPNGYAYNDALGTAAGDRFFQHTLSYGWLFGKLGPRRYSILSGAIWLASIVLMGVLTGQVGLSLIVVLLAAACPAFVVSLCHVNKPEILGWAFLPMALYFIAQGNVLWAASMLFVLSITSITMVIPAAGFAGLLWITGWLPFWSMVLIGLPTAIKVGVQFLRFMLRVGLRQYTEVIGGSGKSKTLTNPQVIKYMRTIVHGQKAWMLLHTLSALALWLAGVPFGFALALLTPVIVLFINYRGFRWADQPTFGRLFVAFGAPYVLLFPGWVSLIGFIIVFLAVHPRMAVEAGGIDMSHLIGGDRLSNYPYTTPIHLGKPTADRVRQFFSTVANGERVAWEAADPFSASLGGYRHVSFFLEWAVNDRHIEIIPGEWLRATQTDWYLDRWSKINDDIAPAECVEACREGGVQYLLTSLPGLTQNLIAGGFQLIDQLSADTLRQSCLGSLMTPDRTLHLLRVPEPISLLDPGANPARQANQLTFEGRANTPYFLKYNFHPGWSGAVSGQPLKIVKSRRGALTGMEITTPVDGTVMLRFHGGGLL